MKRSQVVIALANVASKGKYEVTPAGSKTMNDVFVAVAELINKLEEEEAAQEAFAATLGDEEESNSE